MTVPIPPADLTWLHMDRPNNLMYMHGVLWLTESPDWDAVEQVMQERIVERFPVFRRRAAEVDGTWVWEDVPGFSFTDQRRRVTLSGSGGVDEAQQYISSRFSDQLDPDKPLWEVDFIDGAPAVDGTGTGAMVLARFHHGMADGVRLVQVLLSLLDPLTEDAVPSAVGRHRKRRGPAGNAVRAVRQVAGGSADLVAGMGSTLTRAPGWVTKAKPRVVVDGVERLRQPQRVVDAVTGVASEDNKLANTWRSVGRLTLSRGSVETVWSGTVGVEKTVSWISGIPLDTIRDIGRAHHVTINDVLLAAVSLGVTDYLASKGETEVDQLSWLIPVSLKPIDANLPEELGNHFALVMLPMPLGISDPALLLRELRTRMNRIKNSAEPVLVYGVQRIIAETPSAVSVRLTNLVANKAVGLLTNVPGPRAPMALAGTEVASILGWVPTSGDQPLGLCIFSYNGTVSIGIATDAGLIADPGLMAEKIEAAIHRLAADRASVKVGAG
ncbi:MAG: WS/DGAT domain-containing protein [Jiangellales bacterium]